MASSAPRPLSLFSTMGFAHLHFLLWASLVFMWTVCKPRQQEHFLWGLADLCVHISSASNDLAGTCSKSYTLWSLVENSCVWEDIKISKEGSFSVDGTQAVMPSSGPSTEEDVRNFPNSSITQNHQVDNLQSSWTRLDYAPQPVRLSNCGVMWSHASPDV